MPFWKEVEKAFGGRRGDNGAAERARLEQERQQRENQVRQQKAQEAALAEQQRAEEERKKELQRKEKELQEARRKQQLLADVQVHSPAATLEDVVTLDEYYASHPISVRLMDVTCLIGSKGCGKTTLLYILKVVHDAPVPSTEDQTINFTIHDTFMDTVGTSINENNIFRFVAVLLNKGIVPKNFVLIHNHRVAPAIQILRDCEFQNVSYLNIDCRRSLESRSLVTDTLVYQDARDKLGLTTIATAEDLDSLRRSCFGSSSPTVSFPSILKKDGSTYKVEFSPASKLNFTVLKHLYDLKMNAKAYPTDKDFLNMI